MTLLGKMVEGAKVFGSGSYIQDGNYGFIVLRMFEQKGYEGEAFIAELEVETAEAQYPDVKPNPVGSAASVVFNVTKTGDAAKGNIKEIIMGLYGVSEDEVTEELYELVVSEDNPTRGMRLGCRTIKKTNQGRKTPANRGQVMTVPKWKTVEQTEEEISARRAKLDAAAKAAPATKSEPAKTEPAATTSTKSNKGILAAALAKRGK